MTNQPDPLDALAALVNRLDYESLDYEAQEIIDACVAKYSIEEIRAFMQRAGVPEGWRRQFLSAASYISGSRE